MKMSLLQTVEALIKMGWHERTEAFWNEQGAGVKLGREARKGSQVVLSQMKRA